MQNMIYGPEGFIRLDANHKACLETEEYGKKGKGLCWACEIQLAMGISRESVEQEHDMPVRCTQCNEFKMMTPQRVEVLSKFDVELWPKERDGMGGQGMPLGAASAFAGRVHDFQERQYKEQKAVEYYDEANRAWD